MIDFQLLILALRGLNKNRLMNMQEVEKMRNRADTTKFYDKVPNISFSPRAPGWNDIYRGLLAPQAKEYSNYLKPIIEKLNGEKRMQQREKNENKFIQILRMLAKEEGLVRQQLQLAQNISREEDKQPSEDTKNQTQRTSPVKKEEHTDSRLVEAQSSDESLLSSPTRSPKKSQGFRHEQRSKSLNLETVDMEKNYFLRMILTDPHIKAEMLRDYKIRRKSCCCQHCKVKRSARQGAELRDPLAAYLHQSEIRVNPDVRDRFRKNVILALKMAREKQHLEATSYKFIKIKKKENKPLFKLIKSQTQKSRVSLTGLKNNTSGNQQNSPRLTPHEEENDSSSMMSRDTSQFSRGNKFKSSRKKSQDEKDSKNGIGNIINKTKLQKKLTIAKFALERDGEQEDAKNQEDFKEELHDRQKRGGDIKIISDGQEESLESPINEGGRIQSNRRGSGLLGKERTESPIKSQMTLQQSRIENTLQVMPKSNRQGERRGSQSRRSSLRPPPSLSFLPISRIISKKTSNQQLAREDGNDKSAAVDDNEQEIDNHESILILLASILLQVERLASLISINQCKRSSPNLSFKHSNNKKENKIISSISLYTQNLIKKDQDETESLELNKKQKKIAKQVLKFFYTKNKPNVQ